MKLTPILLSSGKLFDDSLSLKGFLYMFGWKYFRNAIPVRAIIKQEKLTLWMINVVYVKKKRTQLAMLSYYGIMLGRVGLACGRVFIPIFSVCWSYWSGGRTYVSMET